METCWLAPNALKAPSTTPRDRWVTSPRPSNPAVLPHPTGFHRTSFRSPFVHPAAVSRSRSLSLTCPFVSEQRQHGPLHLLPAATSTGRRRTAVRAQHGESNGSPTSPSPSTSPSPVAPDVESDGGSAPGGKGFDAAGAGSSFLAPQWITNLAKLLQGPDNSNIPVADAQMDDIKDLLGGALFLPLFRWMLTTGPVYRLAAGPRNFVIIGEPEAAKHVLRNYGTKYCKGLVSEISEFLFGSGFAIAEGEAWAVRRKAVSPALHRRYLAVMVDTVFGACSDRLAGKLEGVAVRGEAVNIEACFSQLTLDVIGRAVFSYDFDSLSKDSPVIQAVYTALKEAEERSRDILPYWQIPLLCQIDPRQRKAAAAVALIRAETERLVAQCKAMVEAEGERVTGEEYINQEDPSLLRFLLASREEVSSTQLRDDVLSMLVAGHETTGSVLTWTTYLLAQNPAAQARVQAEVDSVLQGRPPTFADTRELKYIVRCINESMRLYPHPPVLLRRALTEDIIPGGYSVSPGQDVMISVYNVHHNPKVWDRAEEFIPERFDINGPIPNEVNTDFRYIPFSGGPRKCIGDQFALLESTIALAKLFQQFEVELVPNQDIGMTTGATIHTKNGLYMYVKARQPQSVPTPAPALA